MRRSAGDGSIYQRKTGVNFSGLEIFTSGRHMLPNIALRKRPKYSYTSRVLVRVGKRKRPRMETSSLYSMVHAGM
jgi:hypothetical protein